MHPNLVRAMMRVHLLRAQLRLGLGAVSTDSPASTLTTSQLRLLPHELNFRDHMPNYSYLKFAELSANKWFYQTDLFAKASLTTWVLAAQQVVYVRAINALSAFTLTTQLHAWDDKYIYLHHRFQVGSTLSAEVFAKVLLNTEAGRLNPVQLFGAGAASQLVGDWQVLQASIKQLP